MLNLDNKILEPDTTKYSSNMITLSQTNTTQLTNRAKTQSQTALYNKTVDGETFMKST